MKYFYLITNWLFGILFLLFGILFTFSSIKIGVFWFLMALLMLPISRKYFHAKTKKEISLKNRCGLVFLLFLTSLFFMVQEANHKNEIIKAEKIRIAAEEKQKIVEDFNNNRTRIISGMTEALNIKKYQEVINISRKYSVVKDEELRQILTQAKTELKKEKNAKRTSNLLYIIKTLPEQDVKQNKQIYKKLALLNPKNKQYIDKLDFYTRKENEMRKKAIEKANDIRRKNIEEQLITIPVSEYKQNKKLYDKLVRLYPDNKKYLEKQKFYSKKIEKLRQKQRRRRQIAEQFSSWDGSHYNLSRAIKATMNDPSSYEHVKTTYYDKGNYIIVLTVFRGKNAFGALILDSVKAKISDGGIILQILDD